MIYGINGGLFNARVRREPKVVVGPDHDQLLALNNNLGVLPRAYGTEIRIETGFLRLLRARKAFTLIKYIHELVSLHQIVDGCMFGE